MNFAFFTNNSAFFIFIVLLTLFVFWKRRNMAIEGNFPFLYIMMYRTKIGLNKMKKWSEKHPRVFLYLSYYSIFIGIVGAIGMFIFMFWQLGFIVENQITAGGGLVLPLDVGTDSPVPVFTVPFLYWIIGLFVLMFVHEFAHGVIAERFKIKVKSSGFAFFGLFLPLLPGAFVEPDENSLKKAKSWHKLAVFGAGSASNFLFGFLFLAMWIFLAGPFIDSTMEVDKFSFMGVSNQSDLIKYNVSSGELLAIDNYTVNNGLLEKVSNLSVNETYDVTIRQNGTENTYEVMAFANSQIPGGGRGMIGISGVDISLDNKDSWEWLGDFPIFFERMFFWLMFLNIGIGMMNLLPIWITDGGQITRELLTKKFKEKTALRLYNIISWVSLILIIFTLYPTLLF
ncbi:MAG: site-2 protease family protein [Nanoarchaeota archaeon]